MAQQSSTILLALLLSSLLSSFINVGFAGSIGRRLAGENPLTAKEALTRYWGNHISKKLPNPKFFLDKASPLNARDLATFSKLAEENSLSPRLTEFCSKANLLCGQDFLDSMLKQISIDRELTANVRVEPGNSLAYCASFRESMLKTGTKMPMPDLSDKMTKRSFLPQAIASKLSLSSSQLGIFQEIIQEGYAEDSGYKGGYVGSRLAVHQCASAPNAGDMTRCVGSGEDMIDFVKSALGQNVEPRATENNRGSRGDIVIGSVRGINGGKITKLVTCHQSLHPYLVYYCHVVSNVRVYEADILDLSTKARINRGMAVCHLNTSSRGSVREAFMALGSGPGKIEVCHWIFENDLIWVTAD